MNTVLNVKLEPFDPDRHREPLWKWLSSPHVVRWWGEPELQLAISLLRPNTGDHALITADSSPVGYLRWQRVDLPVCHEIGLHDIPRRCSRSWYFDWRTAVSRTLQQYQDPEYGPCWVMVVDCRCFA